MTVTVELMGGLGNQLFQICTLIATAIKHKQPFKIQNSKILTHGTKRNTYWDTMLCSLRPFLCDISLLNFPIYREKQFMYNDIPCITDDTKLLGYFQSEKYFSEHKNLIWQILDIDNKIHTVKQKYNIRSVSSIHFRITGYKEISDYHPLCTVDYYRKAIQEVQAEEYLIFCQPEDRDVVEDMVKSLNLSNVTYIQDTIPDWEQMLLMASCVSHVIANSTFSWWGAYFSQSTKVVYPKTWFGPSAQGNTNDLIPNGWIGI